MGDSFGYEAVFGTLATPENFLAGWLARVSSKHAAAVYGKLSIPDMLEFTSSWCALCKILFNNETTYLSSPVPFAFRCERLITNSYAQFVVWNAKTTLHAVFESTVSTLRVKELASTDDLSSELLDDGVVTPVIDQLRSAIGIGVFVESHIRAHHPMCEMNEILDQVEAITSALQAVGLWLCAGSMMREFKRDRPESFSNGGMTDLAMYIFRQEQMNGESADLADRLVRMKTCANAYRTANRRLIALPASEVSELRIAMQKDCLRSSFIVSGLYNVELRKWGNAYSFFDHSIQNLGCRRLEKEFLFTKQMCVRMRIPMTSAEMMESVEPFDEVVPHMKEGVSPLHVFVSTTGVPIDSTRLSCHCPGTAAVTCVVCKQQIEAGAPRCELADLAHVCKRIHSAHRICLYGEEGQEGRSSSPALCSCSMFATGKRFVVGHATVSRPSTVHC